MSAGAGINRAPESPSQTGSHAPAGPLQALPRSAFFLVVCLLRDWGRIGTNGKETNGKEIVEIYDNEIKAGEALEAVARVKRRRGYRDL
ncbi:WGR domain-containing protein [Microvirga aerophila]|uniref:WGR domain-containing protein n=1 Tax=Microvirga aerophila TaxID=670291 RepID=A0A512C501_9HYPH|nr:WGR domain-containing protein [Microvirga aerophila]GEO19278.1 hypothetical protein MAE02_69740 [Microvirga aerophila]